MKLHDLMPNIGKRKVGKRKGHGISAGQGKTAGRGTKGQSSRAGFGGNLYRQGGNLPFYRRLPFIRGEGFTPPGQVEYNEINIDQLDRFQKGSIVSKETLVEAKLLHKPSNPIALLGRGEMKVAITVKVDRITKTAREKIEAAGGKVELVA
jgi:large subunit ribosomal protein L15